MAAGFWKKLLAGAFAEEAKAELDAAEADKLKAEGHVRRHYYFDGRVQEVGFRYTAFYIAENLGLTGWVANLSDGRVELEIQGKAELIDLFLVKLNGSGRIEITGMETRECALCREDSFRVKG